MTNKFKNYKNKESVKDQYRTPANLEVRRYLNEKFSVGKNEYGWYEWVFKYFDLSKGVRILELGCGMGNLWVANSENIPKNWDITLSDFSFGMLDQAKKNVKNIDHKFQFQLIDAEKIPFADETFDVVIANHLLYLVPDIDTAIKEVCRVIKPGGVFFASTSGSKYMKELEQLLIESHLPVHTKYSSYAFSLENGEGFLKKYFSMIDLFYYDDALLVTEARPMADYVLSINQDLTAIQKEEVYQFFVDYFNQNPELYISKQTGLFVARKKFM